MAKKTAPEPVARTKRTPAERAADALGVAQRAVTKWDEKLAAANAVKAEADAELEAAVKRLRYLSDNPDLTPEQREQAAQFLTSWPQG